jgi:hypothetical protein
MAEDWFESLSKELDKKTDEIASDVGEHNSQKTDINKQLIGDFWKIWLKFNERGAHFTMEPSHTAFAQFEEFPSIWKFKQKFDFSRVNTIQLIDRTQDEGRVGDSIKAWYYQTAKAPHVRLVFEYCEGEHYYKYSGWKRIFTQRILYDATVNSVSLDKVHKVLTDIVSVWYESHLRGNRDLLIEHIKGKYDKGETFTQ